MKVQLVRSAFAVVAGALASVFTPVVTVAPSAWMAAELVVPDGEHKGAKYKSELTPYLAEPVDMLGPDSPHNEVAVMKSAQTGFTLMLQGSIGHSIAADPCDMMVVQPTQAALGDFNSQKLSRAIELSPALAKVVLPATTRQGKASTTTEKKFGHNSIFLAIATSSSDLSSKTIKRAYCDEVDRYPADVDEQGPPLDLIARRQTTFLVSGTWKRLYISTPVIKGASEIERRYLAGDQRRWHVDCPHCATAIVLEFGEPGDPRTHGLKFEPTFPHRAHYVTQCCGGIVEYWQKRELVARGRWIATAPAPGKYPSYHFDAISSPFVPWDQIAKEFAECGEDSGKLKAFWNLQLGLPYEVKGDAPDYVKLLERREDYPAGVIPGAGLMLTAFADVQHYGLWVEVVAWSRDRQSWTVYADLLKGDTMDPAGGAWSKLDELLGRNWPDAFGGTRRIDACGVDAGDGARSNQVYAFTRTRPGTFATKGVPGWWAPSIGVAVPVDVALDGRKIKNAAELRAIGTWSVKAGVYADLHKEGRAAGRDLDPPGYCHFGRFLDEQFFKQLTAEYLVDVERKGRVDKEWHVRGGGNAPNHFLDCRVGNVAMADMLGLSRMTPAEWDALARLRAPALLDQADLFTPAPVAVQANAEQVAAAVDQVDAAADRPEGDATAIGGAPAPAAPAENLPSSSSSWLGRDTSGWSRR